MAGTRPSAAPTTAVTKYARSEENGFNLPELLQKFPQKIALACPPGMDPERMLRVALTAFYRTPTLWDCDPVSVAGAIVQAAMLGLEVDGVTGLAYLVPFWNNKVTPRRRECQMITGYKGYVLLGRRSGEIISSSAEMVRAADDFDFAEGDTPYVRHTPYIIRRDAGNLRWSCVSPEDRGDIVAAYAVIKLKGGGHQQKVMGLPEIFQIRDDNAGRDKAGEIAGPWVEFEDWMCKKTVIKQLYKLAPLSADVRTAVALDDRSEAGMSQQLDDLIQDVTEERPANPRGPVPVGTAGAAAPKAAGGPESPGEAKPAGAASSATSATAAREEGPPPNWDDREFGEEPKREAKPDTKPSDIKPLTVDAFTAQELQNLQYQLRVAKIAMNRAQVEMWLATRFLAGQKESALAEAARVSRV